MRPARRFVFRGLSPIRARLRGSDCPEQECHSDDRDTSQLLLAGPDILLETETCLRCHVKHRMFTRTIPRANRSGLKTPQCQRTALPCNTVVQVQIETVREKAYVVGQMNAVYVAVSSTWTIPEKQPRLLLILTGQPEKDCCCLSRISFLILLVNDSHVSRYTPEDT